MLSPASDLEDVLAEALRALAVTRPVFHSEADLQLALAWQIQMQQPDARLRLEQRILDAPRIELDIRVDVGQLCFGVELKYLRASLDVVVDGERFVLVQGAADLDHYDLIKDITRIERLVDIGRVDAGAVVALSNRPACWREPRQVRQTGFNAFCVHDGAVLSGRVAWGASAGAGTRAGRESAHTLRGEYRPRWKPYSRLAATNGEFRSLVLITSSI